MGIGKIAGMGLKMGQRILSKFTRTSADDLAKAQIGELAEMIAKNADESATISISKYLGKDWFAQRAAKKAAQESLFNAVEQTIKSKGDEVRKISITKPVSHLEQQNANKVLLYSSWYLDALKHADEYSPFKNIMSFDQWALVKYGDCKSQKFAEQLIKSQPRPSIKELIKNLFSRKKDAQPQELLTNLIKSKGDKVKKFSLGQDGIPIDEIKPPKTLAVKDVEISYGAKEKTRKAVEITV